MGKISTIQWTDGTHNFWEGCNKVSEGCKYCYAERMFARWNKPFTTVRRIKNFDAPLKWKEGQKIFVCNTSDFFHPAADLWRAEAWDIIKNTPQHTYQVLTKRPERIAQCLPNDWGSGYDNVWMGVSVENNASLTRCQILGNIPSKIRFVSAEPLIDPIFDFRKLFSNYKFHWCIIGGESGNEKGKHRYRKCEIAWIREIIIDCGLHKVPVFVKQLGTHLANELKLNDHRGGEIFEWEKTIQIREFPKTQ